LQSEVRGSGVRGSGVRGSAARGSAVRGSAADGAADSAGADEVDGALGVDLLTAGGGPPRFARAGAVVAGGVEGAAGVATWSSMT